MNDFGSCDCRFLIEKRIHIIADRKSKIRFFLPIFCPSIQYCFLRFFSTLNGLSFNSMQLSPLAWRLWALCALPSSAPSRDLFGRFRPAPRPGGIGIPRENSEMLHALCHIRYELYALYTLLYALCPLSLDISENQE